MSVSQLQMCRGKRRRRKSRAQRKVGSLFPLFPLFALPFTAKKTSLGAGRLPRCFYGEEQEAEEFQELPSRSRVRQRLSAQLDKLSGGPDGLTGSTRVDGTVPRPPYSPAVFTYAA